MHSLILSNREWDKIQIQQVKKTLDEERILHTLEKDLESTITNKMAIELINRQTALMRIVADTCTQLQVSPFTSIKLSSSWKYFLQPPLKESPSCERKSSYDQFSLDDDLQLCFKSKRFKSSLKKKASSNKKTNKCCQTKRRQQNVGLVDSYLHLQSAMPSSFSANEVKNFTSDEYQQNNHETDRNFHDGVQEDDSDFSPEKARSYIYVDESYKAASGMVHPLHYSIRYNESIEHSCTMVNDQEIQFYSCPSDIMEGEP